ncbi:DUF1772 domain-containing protein [Pseudomaricurvus alkylphenolicus]|uniref:DUF1772 domain-containing protein n=1 Tax=Pseudomaricurvus alkylphenolicus TaxID=1306991 RepID=UPI0014209A3B|nr:DUF1772 domain-containing protein [Pseudomaricurvus alkylphenolicus]NIB38364.1 DUF1772 domain-containing protein [Pseudomaricurvus alkylphenolicus]
MTIFLHFIVVFTTGLYAGGCLLSSTVVHPARLACSDKEALAHIRADHKYVEYSLPLILLSAVLSSGGYWYLAGMSDLTILVVCVLLFAIVPYSVLVVGPTLHRLMDPSARYEKNEVRGLLQRWTWLHLVRTLVGIAAFAAIIWQKWV